MNKMIAKYFGSEDAGKVLGFRAEMEGKHRRSPKSATPGYELVATFEAGEGTVCNVDEATQCSQDCCSWE